MASQFTATQIEPMAHSSLQADPGILPGTDVIGSGVDVFGEYCGNTSLRLPIIDMSDRSKIDEDTGKVTSELVTVRKATEGMAESIKGSSLSEVAQSFAASVKIEGGNGLFSGEMSAAFNTSTSSKISTR